MTLTLFKPYKRDEREKHYLTQGRNDSMTQRHNDKQNAGVSIQEKYHNLQPRTYNKQQTTDDGPLTIDQ
jgi:hypothetical protein